MTQQVAIFDISVLKKICKKCGKVIYPKITDEGKLVYPKRCRNLLCKNPNWNEDRKNHTVKGIPKIKQNIGKNISVKTPKLTPFDCSECGEPLPESDVSWAVRQNRKLTTKLNLKVCRVCNMDILKQETVRGNAVI